MTARPPPLTGRARPSNGRGAPGHTGLALFGVVVLGVIPGGGGCERGVIEGQGSHIRYWPFSFWCGSCKREATMKRRTRRVAWRGVRRRRGAQRNYPPVRHLRRHHPFPHHLHHSPVKHAITIFLLRTVAGESPRWARVILTRGVYTGTLFTFAYGAYISFTIINRLIIPPELILPTSGQTPEPTPYPPTPPLRTPTPSDADRTGYPPAPYPSLPPPHSYGTVHTPMSKEGSSAAHVTHGSPKKKNNKGQPVSPYAPSPPGALSPTNPGRDGSDVNLRIHACSPVTRSARYHGG